jgi:hypothetical protein
LFDLRDGFGELFPLALCPTCDTYFPEHLGTCKWCGSAPAPKPIDPRIWKGIGIGACVVLVGVAWMLHDTPPRHSGTARQVAEPKVEMSVVPPDTAVVIAQAESTVTRQQMSVAGGIGRDTIAAPLPTPTVAPTVTPPAAAAPAPPPTAAKPNTSARWESSIAKGWAVIRAGPSRDSRLVASIGPNSRVQLGETRGDWRRIRARGLTGWVQPGSLFVPVSSSRSRVLGSR